MDTSFPTGGGTSQWKVIGLLPSFNDFQGALDKADVYFTASIDFDEKSSGVSEVIFETGGAVVGFSLVYESGNRLVLRVVGKEGLRLASIERVLSQAEIDSDQVAVTWGCDILAGSTTQTIGLWIDGVIVSETSRELDGDWSGGGDAALGVLNLDEGSVAATGHRRHYRRDRFRVGDNRSDRRLTDVS